MAFGNIDKHVYNPLKPDLNEDGSDNKLEMIVSFKSRCSDVAFSVAVSDLFSDYGFTATLNTHVDQHSVGTYTKFKFIEKEDTLYEMISNKFDSEISKTGIHSEFHNGQRNFLESLLVLEESISFDISELFDRTGQTAGVRPDSEMAGIFMTFLPFDANKNFDLKQRMTSLVTDLAKEKYKSLSTEKLTQAISYMLQQEHLSHRNFSTLDGLEGMCSSASNYIDFLETV